MGMSDQLAGRVADGLVWTAAGDEHSGLEDIDVGGVGGTLAGNAVSLAGIRATLGEVLTPEAYPGLSPEACAILNTPLEECDPDVLRLVLCALAHHLADVLPPELGMTDGKAVFSALWGRLGALSGDASTAAAAAPPARQPPPPTQEVVGAEASPLSPPRPG